VCKGDSSDDARMPTPLANPLIDVSELAAQLANENLLILDCRFDLARPAWGRGEHAAAHIPGALYAHLDEDLSARPTPLTGRHPLPSAAAFAAILSRWGLQPTTDVVAYDQGNGAHASRLWWMLRAVGHPLVRVLDGGYAAWSAAGRPVGAAIRAARVSNFLPREFAGVVTTAEVAAGLVAKAIHLVDARATDRFAGQNEVIDPIAGHVPGAVNHPFALNLGSDGKFLAVSSLRSAWQSTLADRPVHEVVAMCGSGVTACHNLLALEVAGKPGAKLYAGSYSEWIRDPQRAVVTGAAST
jgi:thiosulfate/3-mercaptopyruvate sulfurtransferase